MDFENLEFYRDNFNVVQFWTASAAVGGIVPVITFIVAIFWWIRCSDLWKADERAREKRPRIIEADTRWLQ